jgi:acetolactate decarboxylase
MGLDAALVAAAPLHRRRSDPTGSAAGDAVFQLSLAHVLLEGGYDGVATIGDVLESGDHGLGTVDHLDGELVVVDGEPWRVDSSGVAAIVPPSTRTPFVVLTTMVAPRRVRLRDVDRDGVIAEIERVIDDPAAVVAVRLEGRFRSVLVRSVPRQEPPYRPYADVCANDEVRWVHAPFTGVFVGFRFPNFGSGSTLPGLHLHGLDAARTTGGHNHDLHVEDAELSVSTGHDVTVALPERSMVDLLDMPSHRRALQRAMLRRGPSTPAALAAHLGLDEAEVRDDLAWMADRGFAEEWADGVGGLGGDPRWRVTLFARHSRLSRRVPDLLVGL